MAAFVLLLILLVGLAGFTFSLLKQRAAAQQQLALMTKEFDERVAERIRELQIAAEVSKQITTLLRLDVLLPEVVKLIWEHFKPYGVYLFLLDETGQRLVMETGATENQVPIQQAQKFEVRLDEEPSLVALAARTRQVIVVPDVRANPQFLFHPLAAKTRSEMTIPMLYGKTLIGVMDIHAEPINYFTEHDVRVMTTLVGQVAVAVQNARLYTR